MLLKFQKMQISKGHLLTVRRDVQRIKDAFFKGKLISEICKNYEKLRERCFSSCYVRGTKKKFRVPMRNRTSHLRIPRSDALPLSHRNPTAREARSITKFI